MAISTLNSHVYSALYLQNKMNKAYLVIGGTVPWDNDENPPMEDENTTKLTNILGYKKLNQYSLARPLNPGENSEYPKVIYNGLEWALVPTDKAYEEGARWLYVDAEIRPEDFPLGEYRQVGIQVDVTPLAGISKPNLTPEELSSEGVLLLYENREPQNRTSSVYVLEKFMIKV